MDPRDKAIRIAEREGFCSVSSNTKWQRLIPRLKEIPCEKRIKFIDGDDPIARKRGMGQPYPTQIEYAACLLGSRDSAGPIPEPADAKELKVKVWRSNGLPDI